MHMKALVHYNYSWAYPDAISAYMQKQASGRGLCYYVSYLIYQDQNLK